MCDAPRASEWGVLLDGIVLPQARGYPKQDNAACGDNNQDNVYGHGNACSVISARVEDGRQQEWQHQE